MKVFVNNNPVEIGLDGEKNLAEVLTGLQNWATDQNHFISEVRINEQPIDIDTQIEEKRPLTEVETIHCEILSPIAYAVSVWAEIRVHLEPFNRLTPELAAQEIETISERLEWIKKITSKLEVFFKSPTENLNFIKNLKALELAIFKIKDNPKLVEKEIPQILTVLNRDIEEGIFKLNLRIMKAGLNPSLPFIRNSIENYIVFLELIEEKLLQTAVNFQKSNIKIGIETLPELAESLAILIVLNKQINETLIPELKAQGWDKDGNQAKREEYAASLQANMDALENAVKNGDFIDAADIIEYEIKENIPSIRDILNEFIKGINNFKI